MKKWQFGYDPDGWLLSMTDANGRTTLLERDAAAKPTAIVGPFGHRTTIALDANGYLSLVDNPAGESTQLVHDADGLLQQVTNPRGYTTTFSYDTSGFLIGHQDAVTATAGLVRTQTPTGWEVTFTTPEGRATTYGSDFGPVVDEQQNVFPTGQIATLSRDRAGDRAVTLPDGRVITHEPAADERFGLRATNQGTFTIALPSGLQSVTTITETPQLAQADDPLSLTSLTTITSVNGRQFSTIYDTATRTRTEITPEGRTSTTLLDANGRVVETQLPGRLPTFTTYDALGNVIQTSQGTRTWSYSYDTSNELASVTDPLGRTTTFDHDLAGRVTRETSPLGNETLFSYDDNGNMLSLTPPGRPAHTFSYTPVDLESQYAPPVLADVSMPETTYDYNLDRDIELESRPDGRDIDWQYDSAGRLSRLAFPAETRDYNYDPATGQLASITSTSGEGLAFEYDGDLVTKTTWSGTINASVEKQYDPNFHVVRETINGAHAVDYVYDQDGLLVQAGAMTIQRDPGTGFVTGTALDNITTQTTYNDYGERETHAAWFGTTLLYWEQHERDELGRITKTTEIVEGVTKVWEYAYDLDARLSEAYVDGQLRYSYTYDANGNRIRFEDPVAGLVITADYDDQDRLLRYGDTTYHYTASGELLAEISTTGTTMYEYDVFSNLRGMTLADGSSVDYTIDPSNRRAASFEAGTFHQGFVYRDDLEPLAKLDPSNTVNQRYIYGAFGHVPDYFEDGIDRFAYVTDLRGSVRLLVDSVSGGIVERRSYSPFGVQSSAASVQPFGYVGSISSASGSLRIGPRDYKPRLGRWATPDRRRYPTRLPQALWSYGSNNPINLIDTNGRAPRRPDVGPRPRVPVLPPIDACGSLTEICPVDREDYGRRLVRCVPRCSHCESPPAWTDDQENGCPSTVYVSCEVDDEEE